MSTVTIILITQLPVLLIYLFYLRYFHIKPSFADHLEYFLYGILLAIIVLILNSYIHTTNDFNHPFIVGFFKAAFVEKLGAFLFIYFLIFNRVKGLDVTNVLISAMLLGLGFATVENIFYAISVHKSVVFVRLISSVPLHVLTCGLIGYFLSIMIMNKSRLNKIILIVSAFFIPFVFHGLFDSFLFLGGKATYLVAPLVIILIIINEYIFAKSQSFPSLDELKTQSIHYEDWVIIQREPQYERWILRSMGSRKLKDRISFFRFNLGFLKIAFLLLILSFAIVSFNNQNFIGNIIKAKLKKEEIFMIFSFLPGLYFLNLLIIGIVNPEYFKNSVIRIPIIIDADVFYGKKLITTITYHLTNCNCYLKTPVTIGVGKELEVEFKCAHFKSPRLEAVSIWDVHKDRHQFSGTLIRFKKVPKMYYVFLFRYYLYRFSKGLTFNLRLPGFQNIRKLFVRPVSVMQKEWRFNKGQVIFEQGEKGRDFYLIRRGEVDIIKTTEAGEKVLLTTLNEGEIFGEMAIAGDQPRLASAVCKTNSILAIAHGENLDALVESNPEFTRALIKNFANRINASETILLNNLKRIEERDKLKEDFLISFIKIIFASSEIKIKNKEITISLDMAQIKKKYNLNKILVSKLEKLFSEKDLGTIIKMVPEIDIGDFTIKLKKFNVKIEI